MSVTRKSVTNKVFVLRGLPGSGKSSWAKEQGAKLRRQGVTVRFYSADDYFRDESGVYTFDPSKIGLAHAECFRGFLQCLRETPSGRWSSVTIVDNTNLSAVECAPYMAGAAAYGWEAVVLDVQCDPELAFSRQTHGVPRHVFDRMVEVLHGEKLPPWWARQTLMSCRNAGPNSDGLVDGGLCDTTDDDRVTDDAHEGCET